MLSGIKSMPGQQVSKKKSVASLGDSDHKYGIEHVEVGTATGLEILMFISYF